MGTVADLIVLVVMVGPQAAGKSTVSTALASDLRLHGETVALVELDQIAAMALPTLPDWAVALEIFGSVTALWVAAGITCVVAEGVGSSAEVARVRAKAPRGAAVLTVAVTTSLSSAYARRRKTHRAECPRTTPSWPESIRTGRTSFSDWPPTS